MDLALRLLFLVSFSLSFLRRYSLLETVVSRFFLSSRTWVHVSPGEILTESAAADQQRVRSKSKSERNPSDSPGAALDRGPTNARPGTSGIAVPTISVTFRILAHHSDGAAIYGVLSGLAIVYETLQKIRVVELLDLLPQLLAGEKKPADGIMPVGDGRRRTALSLFTEGSVRRLGESLGCEVQTSGEVVSTQQVEATTTRSGGYIYSAGEATQRQEEGEEQRSEEERGFVCVKAGFGREIGGGPRASGGLTSKKKFGFCAQRCFDPGPAKPKTDVSFHPGGAEQPYPTNVLAFLERLPINLAQCLLCRQRAANHKTTTVLLYTLGMETGTPLLHAYAYYNMNRGALTGPPPYAGLLELRPPLPRPNKQTPDHSAPDSPTDSDLLADTAFIESRMKNCLYVHSAGRCPVSSPFSLPNNAMPTDPVLVVDLYRRRRANGGVLREFYGLTNTSCVFVSEPGAFWFMDVSDPTIKIDQWRRQRSLSEKTVAGRRFLKKPDNTRQMYYSQIAKTLVVELGSHWADSVLAFRSRRGAGSFVLHCKHLVLSENGKMFVQEDWDVFRPNLAMREHAHFVGEPIHVIAGSDDWKLIGASRGCPTGVFSRGHCVGSGRNTTFPGFMWLTRESDQGGECPRKRWGKGDGYMRWTP